MSSPRVGAIWAQDPAGIIGANGDMLWRVPADFRHFKAATLGGVVIMGRTTWESIGAALPGRSCLVLTRRPSWQAELATPSPGLVPALAAAPGLLEQMGPDPREGAYREDPRIWVIGGGSVYAQALEAGLLSDVVVSVLDLDAGQVARERALTEHLVHVPVLNPREWVRDAARSDAAGSWRERSGDARWRVERYRRAH